MGILVKPKDERLQIIYHPDEYAEGVRILMLTTRSKDGGRTNNPDRQASNKKYITRSKEEYYEKLDELLEVMLPTQRIYSTVDARDTDKAIRKFKQNQLDADYYDNDSKYGFYDDVYNRWISSLQQPSARASSKFLFDVDEGDDVTEVLRGIKERAPDAEVYCYETKNGHHLVCDPFNPTGMKLAPQKNSMLLVAYYSEELNKKTEIEKVDLPEYKGRT